VTLKKYLFCVLGFMVLLLSVACSNEVHQTKNEKHNEVNVRKNNEWEESATLIKEVVVTDDGKTGDFVFRIGDNGKFGIAEYGPFIAGKTEKYMWHFWGDQETLKKPVKIIGISKETGEKITILHREGAFTLSPHLGADHHMPLLIMLPNSGLWKLEVYFGEELFGNIVVNVKEK
jgi:hypothetical protein